jgi:hypothetical protein
LIEPDLPLAQVILSYEGQLLGKWWIRDVERSPNERFQVHRAVDPNGTFRTSFFEEHRSDFEDRVNLLLFLLGLDLFKYGRISNLTDGPDILAVSKQRHLYVIDCTVGDVDRKGKLYSLYERANRIRELLAGLPDPPVAVQPVIFTSLPRADTATHWATAATYKIALVCRENITNLLDRLEMPPTGDELFAAAVAAIPVARVAQAPPSESGD